MRRFLPLLVGLAGIILALTGVDYPDYGSQTHLNPIFFYNADGTIDTDGSFRAYVDLADSSDSDFQIDFSFDASCSCWVTYSPPERDVMVKIYKIDGADALVYNGYRLSGYGAGWESVDSSAIEPGSLTGDAFKDSTLTGAKIGTGEVGSSNIVSSAAWDNLKAMGTGPTIADVSGNLDIDGDLIFGDAATDSAAFKGDVTFETYQVHTKGTAVLHDSLTAASGYYGYFTLAGLSDIMADPEVTDIMYVASPAFTYYDMYNSVGGAVYKQLIYCSHVRWDKDNPTDSLYVVIPVVISGETFPFQITAIGLK